MPKQRLTDRQLISGVTLTDLLHFVVTGDTSQSPAGSSYKGSVEQLFNGFSSYTCSTPLLLDTVNACTSAITINGNVIINGSATTINTEVIQSKDNNIVLNYSGTHLTAIGGGITLEDGQSNGVDSRIYTDSNGTWLFDPGLSASTGTIDDFTANTISVTTIGNSGDCVNDLYVSNIHSCSPLNINPLDEGNIYFGSTSGVTIDVANSRLGIGTTTPTEKLDVSGNTKISGSLNIGTILSGTPLINLGLDSSGNVVTGSTPFDTFVIAGGYSESTGTLSLLRNDANFVNITGITNTFTTGTTLNGNILEFDRNDLSNAYSVDLSSLQFTGNTSGDCITDLYVTNLYGCSPITVNDSLQSVTSSATGTTSFAFGFQNQANGTYSISLGNQNESNGNTSVSLGNRNTASGNFSIAEGNTTTASGLASHAEGNLSVASGDYSHAQNNRCQSIGSNSFAGGDTSVASGKTSFVFSQNSTVSGNNSVVLGGSNLTGTEDNFVYVPSLEINGEVRELGSSNITGDGTLTISGGVSTIGVRITGTNNVTLPNGSRGQKIMIYVTDNLGVNTTISGSFLGYSTVTLTAIGESVQLLYSPSGWVIIGGNNYVAS